MPRFKRYIGSCLLNRFPLLKRAPMKLAALCWPLPVSQSSLQVAEFVIVWFDDD